MRVLTAPASDLYGEFARNQGMDMEFEVILGFESWSRLLMFFLVKSLYYVNRSLLIVKVGVTLPTGFPGSSAGKESACNAGDPGSIPVSGRSPGEEIGYPLQYSWASLVAQLVKIHLQCGRPGFDPWVGKIPWRRARQPTPVFLPGESPQTEEPGGLQSMGTQCVGHD